MNLGRLVTTDTILTDVEDVDKWALIRRLAALAARNGGDDARAAVLEAVLDREKRGSTGLENGIAVPHARSAAIPELAGALAISRAGINFDSADGKPAHLVFLVTAPPNQSTRYLKALAFIAFIGNRADWIAELVHAASPTNAMAILERISGMYPNGGDAEPRTA